MKKKAVVFDLDGTLLDTLDDLTSSVNFALREFNYQTRDKEYVRKAIGNGVQKLIARCLPFAEDTHDYKDVLASFTNHYARNYDIKTKPYDNIYNTLLNLRENRYILCVATNKLDSIAKDLIHRFFPNIFTIIQGDEPNLRKKPNPDMLNKIIDELFLTKDDILYIGDTNVDYEFANNSGVECLLVTYGYRNSDEIKKYHFGCPSIDDISDIFKHLN